MIDLKMAQTHAGDTLSYRGRRVPETTTYQCETD